MNHFSCGCFEFFVEFEVYANIVVLFFFFLVSFVQKNETKKDNKIFTHKLLVLSEVTRS